MNYKAEIERWFADKEQQMIDGTKRLCAIKSVKEEAKPGMPFGEGPDKALNEALTLAAEMGLTGRNYDGYVGLVDLNDKETEMHILGHMDVVGEGTGWTVCEPYEPTVVDGCIYGRGTADDKGPMVAALMAMQCVKELGIPLTKNVRAILGTDEESGSEDIAYYYQRESFAPCSFSPDADFPVINIEKGGYKPTFTKTWQANTELPRLVSFSGGFRINVIPADAECVIEGIPMGQILARAQLGGRITGCEFRVKPDGPNRIKITAHGKGGHAAFPEGSINALTGLLELVGVMPLAESESKSAVHALLELLPHKQTTGEALGINLSDDLSGALTCAFTLLEINETGLTGRFDSRVPICANEENCKQRVERAFAKHGFACQGDMHPAHHTDANSPFVQTLLRCYEEYTGEKGECVAIGGGTYVHDIPGGVAFGPVMPGTETYIHGPDERIPVAHLMTAAKIFAQVIVEVCA